MIFLEIAHTNVNDMHINIKDVVYFVGFVVTLLTAWFKLKHDNDKQTDQIKHLKEMAEGYKKDCDVAFMNAKHSRSAMRKDYDDKIEKVRVENKETKDSLNTEIQNLSTSLTAVKTDTAEIKGMISTLLNKK
jgi:septal ring factor EnvC (AmiA/AmiB activator)